MELGVRPGVLAEHVDGVEHELSAVEGVGPLPGGGGGVGRPAVEAVEVGGQGPELGFGQYDMASMVHLYDTNLPVPKLQALSAYLYRWWTMDAMSYWPKIPCSTILHLAP